jgi:hypothetical protein
LEGNHHHDDQGNRGQFDPQRIDCALHELGQKPWISRRPNCRSLIVRGFDRSFLMRRLLTIDLTIDDPVTFAQRASLAHFADKYALKLRFPSEADLAAWCADTEGISTPKDAATPEQAYVVGALEFPLPTFGWVGNWQMQWQGANYSCGNDGASYDKTFDNLSAATVRILSGHRVPQ